MTDIVYEATPTLSNFHRSDAFVRGIRGPVGSGKPLALDTPVATPDGWTTMGAIAVGDQVFDERGHPCRVVGLSPIFHGHDCYAVGFDDGSEIIADAEHLWSVEYLGRENGKTHATRGHAVKTKSMTTAHLNASWTKREKIHRGRTTHLSKFAIPLAKPLVLLPKELPIDPYVLGVWLGDGNADSARLTSHWDDWEVVEELMKVGFAPTIAYCRGDSIGINMIRPGHRRREPHPFRKQLKVLDLIKNKHIPAIYLRASLDQRLALLQGLMDTDGYCGLRQSRCEISSSYPALARGIEELLTSLGIKFTTMQKVPTFRYKGELRHGQPSTRMNFTAFDDLRIFRLSRKQCNLMPRPDLVTTSATTRRFITAIDPVVSVPVRCITVDSPSHLFLAGRAMIPTHNSSAVSWEIMRRAREQRPGVDGKRRTRWAIVRNSFPELKDTTLKTWLDWWSEDNFGHFNRQTMVHNIVVADCEIEVLFRALDRPEDVKKVLSLELTGAWVNEARELPKAIIDALGDRCGRYPSMRNGGCTWRGLVMDTNSPDSDHWWYHLSEEKKPKNWEFFNQPGGVIEQDGEWVLNPLAENVANLEPNYYLTRVDGKTRDYVSVYYANNYGYVKDGKPVYPEYFAATHASDAVVVDPTLRLYVGLDFGLTPAACFGQRTDDGRWLWVDELISDDIGMVRFTELLGAKLRREYPHIKLEIWGDPGGDTRAHVEEKTCFEILRAAQIDCRPANTADPVVRREAVATALNRMVGGRPGLLIGPNCKLLRKAMAGGYCYRRMAISGEERYHDVPDKNRYSHVADAAQFLMIGAGEGATVLGRNQQWAPLKYPKTGVV